LACCRKGFVNINAFSIFGVPIPAIYALMLALVMWVITERMPLGTTSVRHRRE
jgi:ribose/xylose/arabinose/galactoside ABC-type transport system permease subunit